MTDYDERPSWREIDKKRDRSSHAGRVEKKERIEGPEDRWKAGRMKDALDRLFQGEKGTVEHDKLFHKMNGAYGSPRFLPTVEKYMAKYGLPDDVSTLILILDVTEDSIVLASMEKLVALLKGLSPRQQEDIRRKLSILALTARSPEVKARAEEALEGLGEE
jgi:hypothetical protein